MDLSLGTLTKDVRSALRGQWRAHIAFDLLLKALASVALLPLSSWIVTKAVQSTGRLAVSNTDIAQFFLSPVGVSVAIVFLAISMWTLIAEGFGHVLIAGSQLAGAPVRTVGTVWFLLKRAPRVLWMTTILTILIAVLIAPPLAVAVLVYGILLSEFDLYHLVTSRPPEVYAALAIVAPFALVSLFALVRYYLRWTLAIPAAVFGNLSVRRALRESRRIASEHSPLVLRFVLLWVGLSIALPIGTSWLLDLGGARAMEVMGDRYSFVVAMAVVLILSYAVLMTAISVICLVGFNASATGLYLRATSSHKMLAEAVEEAEAPSRKGRRRVVIAAAIIATGVGVSGALGAIADIRVDRVVGITAHRGSSGRAPENTLSALRAAIEDGASVAEIDVQETADGAIVLVHDIDLRRLAGDPRGIWEIASSELDTIDAGSWFAPEFAGERIPTLRQALGVARGRIVLNVELKFNGRDEDLVSRVVDVLRRDGTAGGFVVSSLDYPALLEVRAIDPDIDTGFIVASTISDITRMDVDFLAVSTRLATRALVRAARRDGKAVHVWTVNDRGAMLRMIELGVDNIMTDNPALLREVLDERAALSDVEKLLLAFRNLRWS